MVSKTVRNRVTLHLSACKVPFIIAEETRTQKLSDGKNPDLFWESIKNAGTWSHRISWKENLNVLCEMKYFQSDFLVRLFPPKYTEKSTFRSLGMHSMRCYKIVSCICSVMLHDPRGTWVFSKLQGLQYYFPENISSNLTYYQGENFSDSSFHHMFEPENFRFAFFYEK